MRVRGLRVVGVSGLGFRVLRFGGLGLLEFRVWGPRQPLPPD